MPRKTIKLATTYAERSARRSRVKAAKARSAKVATMRAERRSKRLIAKGMLLMPPSAPKRRTKSAGAVAIKVGKRKTTTRKTGVTKGCSTAGRELVKKRTSRAGRYLVTKCGTGKSTAKRRTTTAKRKTTTKKSTAPKSAITKLKVGVSKGKSMNPLKAVAKTIKKVVSSVVGGGTKKRSATKSVATKKRVVRSSASKSKLARIKRIVC
jgi:hypothetical protein